ncbi:MAG TPA: class III extradiol ring-cleavage dioxygenase [Oligoflexus sp.]|uniref:DODA-type extradiol aromatic ring-opening family dioxygenase n=1 Tax=Oligoflexus sp. TaxID=1971216 RepID=UPI002D62594A|nr:class III extradiol ring-cleavage dioxygenase [Oligoflexus sp.]HYX38829.1 class III extradiol ring-cleavage dioxygenase [Oligoflexus sp.]
MSQVSGKKWPTLFISHGGGPWPWMDFGPQNPYQGLRAYLENIPQKLGKPQAILVISGHWEEKSFTVMTHEQPPMLYDYYGFPDETYKIHYKAQGSTTLVRRVHELLNKAGMPCEDDAERGFDHGVFVPLGVMFPKADVPLVQLSMKKTYDVQDHLNLGRALAPLREEGVLIVGSGLSYHNLREFGQPRAIPASKQFDAWLTAAVTSGTGQEREEKLRHWSEAPAARLAHPREDHLIPLMVAAGAAPEESAVKVYSDQMFGLEVSGFQFG